MLMKFRFLSMLMHLESSQKNERTQQEEKEKLKEK